MESCFCKTTACSYVTLLSAYLAKKKMLNVSNRNTRKRCLFISKITLKTSDRRHLITSYLREVTVQNHVLDSFPRIYTNLKSKVEICFQNRRPINSTIVDPYMSFYEKWEIISEIFDSWKLKMSAFSYFWKNSPKKRTNFSFFYLIFKGPPLQYHKARHSNFL